ncbi:hypothetical protein [Pectinatus frisingensis]|uniref:hypothetical protein n=1 Tax=Pectinatus frisingensis TaxID=865 RepID=UPI0018C8286B|nr:hypothetical protein [Pectinatus frisingensis]
MPNKLINMQIKEVSAVDKAANGHKFLIMKKAYSDEERKSMADSGEAEPDGSFPIKTAQDVKNAVHDWGRAGSKESDKAHIIRRAKAIGAEDSLPDDWKGGKKDNMAKRILKKISDILKDDHYLQVSDADTPVTGAQDFNTAYKNGALDAQKDCELDGLISALWVSIDSILDDDSTVDKVTPITSSMNQFMAALMSNKTINKAGRKISADRLNALKEMHKKLTDLIAGAYDSNDGLGDDTVAKGFKEGHPEGCMCDDCVSKREQLKKSAELDNTVDSAIQKRMSDLEKRNKDLEESIKKQKDEAETKEYIKKAASFTNIGIKADEFGPILKSMANSDPEGYKKLDAVLKCANEQIAKGALFSERGADGEGTAEITKRVEGMAQEIKKRDNCTIEKARSTVYRENPDLYREYMKENGGM